MKNKQIYCISSNKKCSGVFCLFCFCCCWCCLFVFLRNTLGTHLSYLPWSLTADNDLEVNRNLNNKPNLFN